MIIREAEIHDIRQIQIVRNSVKENTLSDPNRVTDKDCEEFLTIRGKGWVGEIDNQIVGFTIVDLKENNVWALFLRPEFEKQRIGKQLHETMLDWYFTQTKSIIWLGTTPNTRAEGFYRKLGWSEMGTQGKDEIKFEMTFENWVKLKMNGLLIQSYSTTWAEDFKKIKKILNQEISDYILDIEHVGSTSVPNLAAKPIIDIDIIYREKDDFEKVKSGLEKLGYYHNGNQGIEGREVFKRNGKSENDVLDKIRHHIYVCQRDSVELRRHILFRDYLRKDELTRNYYQQLKQEIAHETNNDKAKYAALKQLKANPFIDYVIELVKEKRKK